MTREEAKRIWPLIQAYSEGKTIEYLITEGEWSELEEPGFCYDSSLYRVKSEPKYRPFRNTEECLEEMKKHDCFGWVINKFTKISINMILICDHFCRFIDEEQNYDCNYEEMVKDYTFLDGTPFGTKVEN